MQSGSLAPLRAVALKGLCTPEALAAALAIAAGAAGAALRALEDAGFVQSTERGYRLTDAGRSELARALESERRGLDPGEVSRLYEEFSALNTRFKQIVTDHQLAGGDVVAQERALRQLRSLHGRFIGIVERASSAIPRLAPFKSRFEAGLAAIERGDARFVASPLVDSYHSVWFEFHQELIDADGRSRAEEAAAGRGA